MTRVKLIREIELDIDLDSLVDDLARFEGLPPYDNCNPCYGDGYYSMSLERKYRLPLRDLVAIRDQEVGKPSVEVKYVK